MDFGRPICRLGNQKRFPDDFMFRTYYSDSKRIALSVSILSYTPAITGKVTFHLKHIQIYQTGGKSQISSLMNASMY